MWVELADNIFQTGVLAITALCAMLFALRTGVRSFWILTFAYTSFALGTLYYVLHLALVGYVPQVFYVSEVSWLAAHLFFFSRELLYTEGNRVGFSPIPALCGVLVAATAVVVGVFGPSPLVKGAFAIVAGGDVYLALWQLRAKIVSGELAAGQALPSMRLLAKELRISVITTKRAYEELEREGLIVTQTGRGSFVAEVSGERLREEQRRAVEKHLADAVHAAKMGGLTAEEFIEIAKTAFEEGEK